MTTFEPVRKNGSRFLREYPLMRWSCSVSVHTGRSDVAYQLLLNRDYPSWGYLIDHGATTTWERWNGDTMRSDPSMNSCSRCCRSKASTRVRYAAMATSKEPNKFCPIAGGGPGGGGRG
ncbi:family 78 glycoside hydrolase catalytic domain [Edaphobacter aggregans]|uniref:alpha-L-rhamnosidase-related protein n=1 Tax=Edaphobacter aggregans TaxID=570835 RepID=UPI000A04D423